MYFSLSKGRMTSMSIAHFPGHTCC